MIAKIESKILPQVWTKDGNRRGIFPIHIDLKMPNKKVQRRQYPISQKGD
jgi:hypothetical protein